MIKIKAIVKYDRYRDIQYRVGYVDTKRCSIEQDTIDQIVDVWCETVKPTEYISYQELLKTVENRLGVKNFVEFFTILRHFKVLGQTDMHLINYTHEMMKKVGGV